MTSAEALVEARRLRERRDDAAALSCLRDFLRQHALAYNEYPAWGGLLGELAAAESAAPSLTRVRLAILGGYTTGSLVQAVRCALLEEGWLAETYEGPFDAYSQAILDPASELQVFAPEMILLALGWRNVLHLPPGPVGSEEVEEALAAEVKACALLWSTVDQRFGCPVLQHVIELPEDNLVGNAELELLWSPTRFVEELNRRLRAAAPPSVRWLDVDRLAARIGRRNWFDSRLYYHGRLGFSPRYLPEYAHAFLGAWRPIKGGIKKALVVDLDNTLWGGVIGDDGLEGICLGDGSASGEAFVDFCCYLRDLKSRGVILAVCSKNETATAAEVFQKHPRMPLRLDDFAVFCCNWEDKAKNLRRIARELNIDLASVVFVEDNPAECELVRRECPEAAVVLLPGDPALFRRALDERHYFDSSVVSQEDLHRAASYVARRKAAELEASVSDLESYLIELGVSGELFRPVLADVPRLAQMETKTNQFNLTSRRYGERDWTDLLGRSDTICLGLRLSDKFADHGLVASLIAVRSADTLRIDSWLMSCRVFSRTAEQFMLNGLVARASQLGIATIRGEYLPTTKNKVVEDLYARLGFREAPGEAGRFWTVDVTPAAASPMRTHVRSRSEERLAVPPGTGPRGG